MMRSAVLVEIHGISLLICRVDGWVTHNLGSRARSPLVALACAYEAAVAVATPVLPAAFSLSASRQAAK